MQPFYTLSNSSGLIRSNKFSDKADAICVATFRAEQLNVPVKIFEHNGTEQVCVLVAMPDGSAKPPMGLGMQQVDLGNESGSRNADEAYILLSAYDEMPITTYYLKSELSESLAKEMEKDLNIEIGLYDPKTLHAYTEDAESLRKLESKMMEASVEIDRVKDSKVKREKLEAAADLVEAARRGHQMARAAKMPEMSVRASVKAGTGLRIQCHCEMVEASGKAPKIRVYADGRPIGEVRNEHEASALMADYANHAFSKFLKKELA